MPSSVGVRPAPVAAAAAVAGLVAVVLLIVRVSAHDWRTGDTTVLVDGLSAIGRCLESGANQRGVSKFALLQQVPTSVLYALGLSGPATVGALVWLNTIAVVGLVAATAVCAFRRAGLPLAVIAALLMTCGMLVPYSAQSFGEALAAAAFGGLALSALRRDEASNWLLLFAVVATVSKETAAPVVFLLGIAALGLSGAGTGVFKRAGTRLLIGVVVGELLTVGFDLLRYGEIYNPIYLAEPRAPQAMWLSNGAGMLISPNAGIAWFWPGAALAIIVLIVAVFRPGVAGPGGRRIRLSAITGLVVLAVTVASLADWWAPFGWYAWGPRLLMPIAAAITVLCLPLIQGYRLPRTWLSVPGAVALGVIFGLALLPAVAVVFRPNTYTAQITGTWREVPRCAPGHVRTPAQINVCNNHNTWSPSSMPLRVSVQQAASSHRFWVIIVLAWLSIALWLRLAYAGCGRGRPSLPPNDRVRGGRIPVSPLNIRCPRSDRA